MLQAVNFTGYLLIRRALIKTRYGIKDISKRILLRYLIPYLRITPRKKMLIRAKMMDLVSYREVSADILVDKSVDIPVNNQPSIGRVSAKYWSGLGCSKAG